ncbi:hypothetical protein [Aliikangiella sp. IMCC44359]|uniref:hypothetical protein n=1 Tax=Aliikangiella sp. IMCC44359 TaxID=3459125 RepID=UPI00403ADF03
MKKRKQYLIVFILLILGIPFNTLALSFYKHHVTAADRAINIKLANNPSLPFNELQIWRGLTSIVPDSANYYPATAQKLDEQTYQINNLPPGYYRYRTRNCNKQTCNAWTYSEVIRINYQQLEFRETRGHTGKLGKKAFIFVNLGYKPSENTTVNITSSNTYEGVVTAKEALPTNNHITQLVFTPDNWNRSRLVIVTGKNPKPVNGVQDYQINFTIEDDELNQYSVKMRGLGIDISVRENNLTNFIPGIPGSLEPIIKYAGKQEHLSYHLVSGPSGMEVDTKTGLIRWTPPNIYHTQNTKKYSSYTARIRATDGVRQAFADLNLNTPKLTKLITIFSQKPNGYKLKVADTSSNLNHLSVHFEDEPPNSINIEQLVSWPSYSNSINRVSEIFKINHSGSANNATLRFPLENLDNSVPAYRLSLYYYWRSIYNNNHSWSFAIRGKIITDESGSKFLEFNVKTFKGPYFIGYKRTDK